MIECKKIIIVWSLNLIQKENIVRHVWKKNLSSSNRKINTPSHDCQVLFVQWKGNVHLPSPDTEYHLWFSHTALEWTYMHLFIQPLNTERQEERQTGSLDQYKHENNKNNSEMWNHNNGLTIRIEDGWINFYKVSWKWSKMKLEFT